MQSVPDSGPISLIFWNIRCCEIPTRSLHTWRGKMLRFLYQRRSVESDTSYGQAPVCTWRSQRESPWGSWDLSSPRLSLIKDVLRVYSIRTVTQTLGLPVNFHNIADSKVQGSLIGLICPLLAWQSTNLDRTPQAKNSGCDLSNGNVSSYPHDP